MPRVAYLVSNPVTFNSFLYVAKVASTYYPGVIALIPYSGYRNIVIGDAVLDINRPGDAYWLDTPLQPNSPKPYEGKEVYVTSEYNRAQLEGIGARVEGVVGRLLHPYFIALPPLPVERRDLDAVIIGYRDPVDRKNLSIACRVVEELGLEYVAITNDPCFKRRYEFGSLGDLEKALLIRRARVLIHPAKNEGFGMPVWEAICLGVLPVVLDITAFLGLPVYRVEAKGPRVIPSPYGYMEAWDTDYERYKEGVVEALKLVSEEGDAMAHRLKRFCVERQGEYLDAFLRRIVGV